MRKIKNLKAFTLIELIIVMAIFSMLMTAIMIMMKPATELANTAIYYDSKRTIANEINTYVCQNIKFAKYAQIYTNCKQLPANAISDFKTFSGATSADIKVIAVINNFSGVSSSNTIALEKNIYNGNATADDYGRIFRSSLVNSSDIVTFYTAMGKWYYGNEKYQYNLDYTNGIVTLTTITYDKGNSGLKASLTSKFLNYDSIKMPAAIAGAGTNSGSNYYIVYV